MGRPIDLNITAEELLAQGDDVYAKALLAGYLRATVESKTTGQHISVRAVCKRKVNNRWTPVTFQEAEKIWVEVPTPDGWATEIGAINGPRARKDPGKFWPPYGQDFDRARGYAARLVLERAAGRLVDERFTVMPGDHCPACGRELDHPDSIKAGIGPDCAERLGIPHAYRSQHQVKGDVAMVPADAETAAVEAALTAPEPTDVGFDFNGNRPAPAPAPDPYAGYEAPAPTPTDDGLLTLAPGQDPREVE